MADNSSLVPLAGTAIPIPDHIMRQHRADPLSALARTIRHNLGHKAAVIVIKDRARHRTEEGKGMHVTVQPSLGVRRRISADVACITVRQIKGKEVRLLFNPVDHNQRFAKVRLPMPWGMAQRNKHLP